MDKKLRQLFDYQKFAGQQDLSAVIAACDESSGREKRGAKILRRYRSSVWTMAGSAAAAALLIVLNVVLANTAGAGGPQTAVGSLFAESGAGYVAAGVILALGAVVSVILYRRNKKNSSR